MGELLLKYRDSRSIKPLIESALEEEAKVIELGVRRTEQNLFKFETQYKMSSSEFYGKMEKGELKDNLEFIEWAGEYETLKKLKENSTILREIEVCT